MAGRLQLKEQAARIPGLGQSGVRLGLTLTEMKEEVIMPKTDGRWSTGIATVLLLAAPLGRALAQSSTSINVDASGKVGIGTATPAQKLHVADGSAPTVRLESTGAPVQTWDLGLGGTNVLGLLVRNSASGSTDSWSFRPGGAFELGLNGILAFEGSVNDEFETALGVVNPTADRTVTIPDADSATARAVSCAGNDKVSAFNAGTGEFTCAPDQTGSTDHGALTGLADDDHPHYQKETDQGAVVG